MKRKLTYTLLAGCAGLLVAAGIHAQTPTPSPSPGEGPDHHGGVLGHLTHALDLSGSQQAAAATVIDAARPQIQAIRQQAKQQVDGVLNSVVTQLDPILSGSQQSKLAAIVQHIENSPGPGSGGWGGGRGFRGHGRNGGEGGFGPGGGGLMEHLTTALGLTDQQQAQIKPLLDSAHTQAQTVFQNQNLTPQQKFEQVTNLMQVANGQINSVLNAQQQAAFAAMKGRFHKRFHGPGGGGGGASPSPSASGS